MLVAEPLIDVVITSCAFTTRRAKITEASIQSFLKNTLYPNIRVTMVFDGSIVVTQEDARRTLAAINDLKTGEVAATVGTVTRDSIDGNVIFHSQNRGLGPSVNEAIGMIAGRNLWHAQRREMNFVSKYTCYLQDDLQYDPAWLTKLKFWHEKYESQYNLGFSTGAECPEHKSKLEWEDAGQKLMLKDWIRMTCMFARSDYFTSMFPIPGMDPETGQKRAKPNDGMGSGCDWWLIRNHPKSVCKSGKTNLVVPGLILHTGFADSTWLARELPESDIDKQRMHEVSE